MRNCSFQPIIRHIKNNRRIRQETVSTEGNSLRRRRPWVAITAT